MIAAEEEEWEARMRQEYGNADDVGDDQDGGVGSFEEYREKSKAAGVMWLWTLGGFRYVDAMITILMGLDKYVA